MPRSANAKTDPEPPHNVELEQALLGAVLINNEAYTRVAGLLSPGHFYEPVHQEFFRAVKAEIEAGRVATPLTLKSGLPSDFSIAGLSASQYLARLVTEATTVVGAADYAEHIRDLADRRALLDAGETIAASARAAGSGLAVGDLVVQSVASLDAILDGRADRRGMKAVTLAEASERAIEAIAAAYQRDGKLTGVTTGLKDLDRATLGLHRSEVTIAAGRPGMGKTAIALNTARAAADAGHGVIFFSLEMGDVALAQRLISDALFDAKPLPYFALRAGHIKEEDFARVVEAGQRVGKLPLVIEQEPTLTIGQVVSRTRRARQRFERMNRALDLVVIDYLQLITPSDRYRGQKVAEVTEISAGIKRLAKEANVAVLALSQLSRQVEMREDKRPQLADLRESGAIEQDADRVIGLFREEYYLAKAEPKEGSDDWFKWEAALKEAENQLDLIVLKQRNGPTCIVRAFFSARDNAIRDHAPNVVPFKERGPA